MRKLLLLASLLFATNAFAQGYSYENFSQGTPGAAPTTTDLNAAWYGTKGTGTSTSVSNSNATLTYQTTSACADGGPPAQFHSGLYLDYNTTQGNGHANQFIQLFYPNEGGIISNGGFFFCSTVPLTDSFGTTGDMFMLICGGCGSRLSNYNSNGSTQNWNIECSGCPGNQSGNGSIPTTSLQGKTYWVTWQQYNGAPCVNNSTVNADHTDCYRIAVFDRTLTTKIGETWAPGGGTLPCNASTNVCDIALGNGNNAAMSSGHHIQFSDVWMCMIGCTVAQFPMLPNLPSTGILTVGRYIDWSKSGISTAANSGTLPSSTWTQCGATVTAGSYSAGAINTLLNACSANTYLFMGPGTFTIDTSAATVTVPSNRVLRGSGANSTFIVAAGSGTPQCGQTSSVVCIHGVGGSSGNNTQSPGAVYNWTAGYAQGTFNITLDSVAGIDTTTPTMLFLDQCDTGLSTTACTGTVTDNGQVFVCQTGYTGSSGCASSGADAGGSRASHSLLEIHTACAINGLVVTLCEPLGAPIWASGQSPQLWKVQPTVNAGIENLSIDVSAAGAATAPIERFNAYHTWISGVRLLNNKRESVNDFQVGYSIGQSSYLFGSTGTLPSNYGWRLSASAYDVVQNNIISHIKGGAIFYDGACFGCIEAYNYVPDSADAVSGDLTPITEHSAEDAFNLHEGTIGPGVSCDNVHGTCYGSTRYRNFWPGWESFPSTPLGTFTNGVADFAFARYIADIAGVYGTPGFHTGYTSASGNHDIYNEGTGHGSPSIPVDPLTKSTTLKWANYDIFHVGVMWCGNAINTNFTNAAFCNSLSEAPAAASTFPNFVPVVGDTAKGQPALPASFYLTSKPSWFQALPWPGIGPDISSGNVGQCTGTINTVGQMAKVPALTNAQCIGTTLSASQWGGHVNANPAMTCALSTMGMAPDGSSGVLPFDAGACYGGTAVPIASFSPSSLNIGLVPQNLTSNPSPTVTLTNTGTANLIVTQITITNGLYTGINNTCGASNTFSQASAGAGFTLTPTSSCTFQVTFSPSGIGVFPGGVQIFDNTSVGSDTLSLTGTSTGSPAPSTIMFAGAQVNLSGKAMF